MRTRLQILFAAGVVLVSVFTLALTLREGKLASEATSIALTAHSPALSKIRIELRSQLAYLSHVRALPPEELKQFEEAISAAHQELKSPGARERVDQLASDYRKFTDSMAKGDSRLALFHWLDVQGSLSSLEDWNSLAIRSKLDQLEAREKRAARQAAVLFLVFFLSVAYLGFQLIGRMTEPMISFARFVDSLDLEKDLPRRIPVNAEGKSGPEMTTLIKSFESLLGRLRGYRALSLQRVFEEKRRFEMMAAALSDGVILLKDKQEVYSNPAGRRILESFALRNERSPGPSESGREVVMRAIARSIPLEYSFEFDGRRLHYLISASRLPGEPSSPSAETLVLAQDVTLMKESNEAKAHFLATISHEVRTPVTSLIMAIRLLERASPRMGDPALQSLVSTCSSDIERLRKLLEDLMHASRLDTLEMQGLSLREVDLAKVLRHTITGFQQMARERGVRIETEVDPGVRGLAIRIDSSKIVWAISNLITNALRHTPRGGEVRVIARKGTEFVQIGVRDTGPGIAAEIQPRIFEKYSPFYDIRVARTGSAGTALSIAREIVQAHGGRIWVSSTPGEGAEFCFTLPLGKANASNLGMGKSAGSTSAGEDTKGATGGASACG